MQRKRSVQIAIASIAACAAILVGPAPALATGTISGTVSEVGGGPLQGVCVAAVNPNNQFELPPSGGSVQTNAAGEYTLNPPNGSYKLLFTDSAPCPGGSGAHVAEWYDDKTAFAEAQVFEVTEGSSFPNTNAALAVVPPASTGTISGTVTEVGGGPLANICVAAVDPNNSFNVTGGFVQTSASGGYTLTPPTGSYKLVFTDSSPCPNSSGAHVTEYYNDTTSFAAAQVFNVTAGSNAPNVNAALAPTPPPATGSISGTITVQGTGAPVHPYCATATRVDGQPAGGVDQTDANGEYKINGLPDGQYRVSFARCSMSSGPNVVPEFWNDKPNLQSVGPSDLVVVDGGDETSGISPQLAPGAAISGTVSGEGGTPAAYENVCVSIFTVTGGMVASVRTSASGDYLADGLPAGSYKVGFQVGGMCPGGPGPAAPNVVGEFANDAPTIDQASVFAVAAGATQDVDAHLAPGATVQGTVTAEGAGTPIQSVCVQVIRHDLTLGAPGQSIPPGALGFATTGPTGQYSITGLREGSFEVHFNPCNPMPGQPAPNFAFEWFDEKADQVAADAQELDAGETLTLDEQLAPGARISGTVSGPSGPVNNVCVHAERTVSGQSVNVRTAITAANGTYEIQGLRGGIPYRLRFQPCGNTSVAGEYWNDKPTAAAADPITPGPGEHVTGRDATLAAAGTISGTVTVPGSTTGVCVQAFPASAASGDEFLTPSAGSAPVQSNGSYVLGGLAQGSYKLRFTQCFGGGGENYATEFYDDRASLGAADPVSVTSGGATPNVNATLVRGGTVSGTITDSGSTGISGVCVALLDPGTGAIRNGTLSGAGGGYTVNGVAPGTYKVKFFTGACPVEQSANAWRTEFHDDKLSLANADAITVTESQTTTVNAQLATPSAPNTTITAGPPAGQSAGTSAAFAFASDQPEDATFMCKLDTPSGPGTFEPCNAGGKTYTGLANGEHTFTVKARESAQGLEDASPATRTWTVADGQPVQTTASSPAGGTVSTDPENTGPSPQLPVTTAVTVPDDGTVSITQQQTVDQQPPAGFAIFGQQIVIEVQNVTSSVTQPLRLTFTLDASAIPAGTDPSTITVLRDGSPAANCTGPAGQAVPDPCVSQRETLAGGDLRLTVLTAHASDWNFARTTTSGSGGGTGGGGTGGGGGGGTGDGGGAGGGGGGTGGGTGDGGGGAEPVRCLVPKLKGLTLAKATSALRAANCTLGKVTKKKVRKGKKGVVVSHSPAAGQSLPAGSPVKVTVSAKKR